MKKLIHEIHRRSLWQVLGIYLVGSWVALQVVDLLADNVGLPEWFPGFALALLVIGLPIVLATAFVQEGIPAPIGRDDAGPSMAEPQPTDPADTALGLFTWRNAIAGGVTAFALLGVATVVWWFADGRPVPPPSVAEASADAVDDLRSVAVLPFVTRSSMEEDAFFADGMHDDLLTQLSKIQELTVISRTSVQKYRETTLSLPEIAEELGVAVIVEGGIQRAGDRVRVNMQLIEAATDRHLWAETYDEELTASNLFHIQSDLAQKIASALRATLTPEVVERLNAQPTRSLEAFDLYSRARYIYERTSASDNGVLRDALALFEQAVAEDSTYALAWAGIADTWQFGSGTVFDAEEARAAAWPAIERALELDPGLAEALSRRALMHLSEGREDEARRDFQRALELNPGSARIISRYGGFLARTGGDMSEAIANARRAVEINPGAIGIRRDLENLLWNAGRFEECARESRRTVSMEPDIVDSWYNLGWCEGMLDRHPDAVAAFTRAVELSDGDPANVVGLAWAHARAGDREQALEQVALVPAGAGGHDVANVYFLAGDVDRAFTELERVLRENARTASFMETDWSTAELRADPRYAQLLRRLGLDG